MRRRDPSRPVWNGTLEGVELADGRYMALPPLALGVLHGVGLVTGRDRSALERGEVFPPRPGRYQRVRAVYYVRRRPGGSRWRHELNATAMVAGSGGPPVFVPLSARRAARVCPRPPGDFICEG